MGTDCRHFDTRISRFAQDPSLAASGTLLARSWEHFCRLWAQFCPRFGAQLPPFQSTFNCFRTSPVVRILASSDGLLVHIIFIFTSFRSDHRAIPARFGFNFQRTSAVFPKLLSSNWCSFRCPNFCSRAVLADVSWQDQNIATTRQYTPPAHGKSAYLITFVNMLLCSFLFLSV